MYNLDHAQRSLIWIAWGISLVLIGGCGSTAKVLPSEVPIQGPELPTMDLASTEQSDQQSKSAQAWRDDIQFLVDQMLVTHPNLFWRVPENEFRQAISDFESSLPQLSDQQIIIELARIVSLIDGHTHLPLFQTDVDFQLYPLRLYLFDDGLYVTDVDEENRELLGSRVIAIGNTDIAEAINAVSPLVPRDNEMTEKLLTPIYLIIPEVLQALGIISETSLPGFVFELPDGQTVVEHLEPVPSSGYRNWSDLFVELAGIPVRSTPVAFERRAEHFWYTIDIESSTLYLQYNLVQSKTESTMSLTSLVEQMEVDLETHSLERVVVDIRHNPGGNVNTIKPLVDFLTNTGTVNRPGGLYVIIGRNTFSAATLFAVDLERSTEVIFVGEPTGGRPNLYGDVARIVLPNSGISVLVSSIYWERSDSEDQRDWIEPDIYTPLTSMDYFKQNDPAMNAILSIANNVEP